MGRNDSSNFNPPNIGFLFFCLLKSNYYIHLLKCIIYLMFSWSNLPLCALSFWVCPSAYSDMCQGPQFLVFSSMLLLCSLDPGGMVNPNVHSLYWWLLHLRRILNQLAVSPSPASDCFINFMVATFWCFWGRENLFVTLCANSPNCVLWYVFCPNKVGLFFRQLLPVYAYALMCMYL